MFAGAGGVFRERRESGRGCGFGVGWGRGGRWGGPCYAGRAGVDPGGYQGAAPFTALGALACVGLFRTLLVNTCRELCFFSLAVRFRERE